MPERIREIQREIVKTRRYLFNLEAKLQKARMKMYSSGDEQRIAEIESEFKAKYPNLPVRRELLALVGTEPYNAPSEDKEVTRRNVAERYGR